MFIALLVKAFSYSGEYTGAVSYFIELNTTARLLRQLGYRRQSVASIVAAVVLAVVDQRAAHRGIRELGVANSARARALRSDGRLLHAPQTARLAGFLALGASSPPRTHSAKSCALRKPAWSWSSGWSR